MWQVSEQLRTWSLKTLRRPGKWLCTLSEVSQGRWDIFTCTGAVHVMYIWTHFHWAWAGPGISWIGEAAASQSNSLIPYYDTKNCCTYPMSIADCGIILMSVYEVQKSTEQTHEYDKWFIFVSYLDILHTYSDVSITRGYDMKRVWLWVTSVQWSRDWITKRHDTS